MLLQLSYFHKMVCKMYHKNVYLTFAILIINDRIYITFHLKVILQKLLQAVSVNLPSLGRIGDRVRIPFE